MTSVGQAWKTACVLLEIDVFHEKTIVWSTVGDYWATLVGGILMKRGGKSAGDRSHPQTQEIYAKLELSLEMETVGYILGIRSILNVMDEERSLCHHSKRLAIAFGLLNTSLEQLLDWSRASEYVLIVTLQPIFKFVAREIVVRDANGFHHFKHGQCSCRIIRDA